LRWLVAVVALAVATGARFALDPWLGDAHPFPLFLGAVIVAAWYGGVAPAIAVAGLGFVVAEYFFIAPRDGGSFADPARLAGFIAYAVSSGLIAGLGGAAHAARQRVQTSEERFRRFMENSPAAVFMKDEAGRYVYMNSAGQGLLGCSDWAGKSDLELLPADTAHEIREHDRQVREADAPAAYELAYRGRQLHSTKFPVRDAAGGAFVGSVTIDVTEQARAAQALRLQREELRLVTDTMSAAMVRVSAELKYIWVNRVFAGWAGRTPEEMVGRPIAAIIGEEGVRELRPYIERLLAGERVDYERLARFPRLGQRWIHSVAEPTLDASGVPNGWVAVISDIHERKESEAALKAAREQLQLVADSMPAAVALCSRDLRYVWVNRRCAEWLGMPPEEVVGRPIGAVIGATTSMPSAPISSGCSPESMCNTSASSPMPAWARAGCATSFRPRATARGGSR
jgi:PAS domain S-box-containing protein